ncbi:MAG: hypothetical protein WAU28_02240, partial [Candidatus Moraniibacteriota bacterium]
MLPETTGERTIAGSQGIFDSIDPKFSDLNATACPTPPTMIFLCLESCYFGSSCISGVKDRWGELFGTQDQVIQFVSEYSEKIMRNRYTTWFPFQMNGQYFLAGIEWRRRNGQGGFQVRLLPVRQRARLDLSDGRHQ